jgi:hypothetical protein
MRHTKSDAVVRSEGYLIFRIENGRLEDWGVHESYAAAEERRKGSGLGPEWKIARVYCWLRARTKEA